MNIGGDLLSLASTQFGLRLLSQLVRNAPGKNVVVSPISLFQALSLYAFLIKEEARQEARKGLRIDSLKEDVLRTLSMRFGERLQIQGEGATLSSATALWAGQDVAFDAAFTALARDWDVPIFSGTEVTEEAMAQWAREQTHGLLSPKLGAPPSKGINLMNAVYFQGKWASPFKKTDTRSKLFYRTGGLPKATPLMHQRETEGLLFYNGPAFSAARIPYQTEGMGDLALHVILPHRSALDVVASKDYMTPFVGGFTLNDWDSCQDRYTDAVVDLVLPRITLRQTHDLKSTLIQMGMRSLFQAGTTLNGSFPALDKVLQQIYLSVDEEGTTAAALTEMANIVGYYVERPHIQKFHVDRPFLFLLANETSGMLLFAGVIHNPSL